MCKTNYTISTVNSRYLWSLCSMKSLQTLNWGMLKTTAPTVNAGSGLWNSGHKTVITDQHITLFSTFPFSPWSTSQPLCTQGHRTAPQHNAQAIQIENSIRKKKLKNVKNVVLNRPWKGFLFTEWGLNPGMQNVPLMTHLDHRGQALRVFTTLHVCMPVNDCRRTVSIDFGVTNNFFFNNFTY